MAEKLSSGIVHKLPEDLKDMILGNNKVKKLWEEISPIARNEWICWIESCKKDETRKKRIEVGKSKMLSGMRRPCCWAGCQHR